VRTPRRGRLAATLAAAMLLAACADDEPDRIGADVEETETAEPDEPDEPEEPEDPFAIPDEIDEEYTQRVLDELLPISAEAQLEALDEAPSSMPPDESMAKIRAVFSPAIAVARLMSLSGAIATEEAAQAELRDFEEHGDTRWVVSELGETSQECISFAFDYEFSEADVDRQGIAALVTAREGRDPAGHNPTPWEIGINGPADGIEEDLDTICAATVEQDAELAEDFDEEMEDEQ
jgi:hypothetical protein